MRSALARLREVTRVDQRAEELVRTWHSGTMSVWLEQLTDAARRRINAPLVRPRGFRTIREYRAWKRQRRTTPAAANPLHWPLGVWLTIALAVVFWIL